jgi:hypothetical protein
MWVMARTSTKPIEKRTTANALAASSVPRSTSQVLTGPFFSETLLNVPTANWLALAFTKIAQASNAFIALGTIDPAIDTTGQQCESAEGFASRGSGRRQ